MRIVFMGTPDFARTALKVLLEQGEQVKAVYSQPDKPRGRGKKVTYSPVKELALAYNLPVYQPTSLKDELVYQQLKDLAPDLIIVVAYGQFLPKKILDIPSMGCINVHASLLPKYRGAAPIHWAIINGEAVTGVTTMFMSEKMDAGDMVLKDTVKISAEMTTGELHDQLAIIGGRVLLDTIKLLESGKCPKFPQDEAEVTYAPMIHDYNEVIKWEQSAEAVVNQIRGMSPWPGAYTWRNGERLKVYMAHIAEGFSERSAPGSVIAYGTKGFIVQTRAGAVEVTRIQPAGKKQMDAAEFLRGYKLKIGEILG